MEFAPTTIEDLRATICESAHILPRGGGTKTALSSPDGNVDAVDISAISGVVEYEPNEFTITAYAGTPVAFISQLLAENRQYLPFDPPMVNRGATLGGTVAAGLSGPGRYRFGGVRDFVLGVRYLNGSGRMVRGGGRVVKNAAGFDIPKLMVGSLGSLGILTELTFKVFPLPESTRTLKVYYENLAAALNGLYSLFPPPFDLDAIDIEITATEVVLWIRLAGFAAGMNERLDRLVDHIGGGEQIDGSDDNIVWRQVREMDWVPEGWSLLKVPMTPGRILPFESSFSQITGEIHSKRRYSCGGQVCWLAFSALPPALDRMLEESDLSALVLIGKPGLRRLGVRVGASFLKRIKAALDPDNRFVEV